MKKIEKNEKYTVVFNECDESDIMPLFCGVCSCAMIQSLDVIAYEKYRCCDFCMTNFVLPDLEKWKSGTRPNSVELEAKLQTRKLAISFI